MRRTALRARRVTYLALLFVGALAARRAQAYELQFDWTAPSECPTRSDILTRVMDLTEGAIQSTSAAAIEVTRDSATYRAHVVVRGPSGFGERSLENPRCDVLAEGVALLLALSLSNRVAPTAQPTPTFGILADGRLLVGALPLPAAGIGAGVAVDGLMSLRIELHGAYYAPQSATLRGMETFSADFKLLSFGASICRLWNFARLSVGPCVGAEINYVRAAGAGGMPSLSGSTSWWGPSLSLLGRVLIVNALGIRLVAEGMLPMSRPSFVFQDVAELHRVSRVALQVLVGPEVRF